MANIINVPTQWAAQSEAKKIQSNIWKRWLTVIDDQAPNETLWYIVSLIAQGVLFLPLPAVLIYYFNAPVSILVITLSLYFANIIAGMGGAGIRIMLAFFMLSVFIHLIMLVVFTL